MKTQNRMKRQYTFFFARRWCLFSPLSPDIRPSTTKIKPFHSGKTGNKYEGFPAAEWKICIHNGNPFIFIIQSATKKKNLYIYIYFLL